MKLAWEGARWDGVGGQNSQIRIGEWPTRKAVGNCGVYANIYRAFKGMSIVGLHHKIIITILERL